MIARMQFGVNKESMLMTHPNDIREKGRKREIPNDLRI